MSTAIYRTDTYDGPDTLEVDTLVVGSGASGAVVAAIRAEAGDRVLVLEEGRHVRPAEYGAMRPSQHLAELWRGAGMTAALGLGNTPVINVTMGRAVGGSSLLTGGVCFRTPDAVLRTWVDERGLEPLGPDAMRPWFEQVERDCNIAPVPTDMRSRSTVLFDQGARRLGYALEPLSRNTRGCNGCGRCNFGCPDGAKLSVDLTYLPRAIAAGATVFSECRVDRLAIDGGHVRGVDAHWLDARRKPTRAIRIRAARTVLACGAAHTPLLLKRHRIGRRDGHVGRHLTLHPAFRMLARFDESVRGWRGAMQSAYSSAFEHERITLVSVFVPPFATAAGIPGFGPALRERVTEMDQLAMFGGMIHDDDGGRVLRGFGREPLMLYRMSRQDRATIGPLLRRLGEAFLEAGATALYPPILGHEPVDADGFRRLDFDAIPARQFECSSQHPLGTCRMGAAVGESVCDHLGRVWDVAGLYLADGSTVPTSLGVNPQETIMAMALRMASLMPSP